MQTAETTKTKWIVDPMHSTIGFSVKYMMMTTVRGEFEKFTLEVETIGEDFTQATILFSADTASVSTKNEAREKHIKGEDFFDVEKYPTITFRPTKVENVDSDGSYELYGDLTIRDITKNIKLDVEFGGVMKDPWGSAKAGFTIHGKVSRKDWDLKWNAALESGGVLVSDEVRINAEIQLIEQK